MKTLVPSLRGVECEPVWSEECGWDVGLQLAHLAVKTRSSEIRPAQLKRSREMQCVVGTTQRAGMDLLRLHYRDHHLQEMSHI